MSVRRGLGWAIALGAVGLLGSLTACEALITDPAPPSEITLQLQVVGTTVGGTPTAFSKVNRLFLRFIRADQSSRDTVLFVQPESGRVRAGVALETEERFSALGIQAELRVGPAPLFVGGAIVPIDPGVPTTAQIPLQPVPARVLASQQTLTLLPTQTAQLSSAVLYATTDTIENLVGAWTSSDATIVAVSAAGLALAVNRGTTDLIVALGNLADTVRATVQ